MNKDDCKRCFGKGYRFMAGHSAHEDNTEPCGDCSGTGKAPFVREDRYIVIKRSDLRGVPELARHALHVALEGVREHLPHRECAVVESDWPEYPVVWAAIEERMRLVDGRPGLAEQGLTRSYEEAFYALASALGFSGARACSPQQALHGLMLPAIELLKEHEAAHREFSDKTDWVQSPSTPARFLGQHRGDIARQMLRDAECERDRARVQRDRLARALQGVLDDNCPLIGEPTHDELVEHWRYEQSQGRGDAVAMLEALEALRAAGVEATPRTTGAITAAELEAFKLGPAYDGEPGTDCWNNALTAVQVALVGREETGRIRSAAGVHAVEPGTAPGGAMTHAYAQVLLSPPSEPVLLRHAISYAVRAQTGASPAAGDAKARAAMCLLSIDGDTVVTGEPS